MAIVPDGDRSRQKNKTQREKTFHGDIHSKKFHCVSQKSFGHTLGIWRLPGQVLAYDYSRLTLSLMIIASLATASLPARSAAPRATTASASTFGDDVGQVGEVESFFPVWR